MAQWIETLEPYIRVQEQVRQTALNPVAGEDLIIGVVLISDAGSADPTLITSQAEYLSTYSSQDITRDYLSSLNQLYSGDDTQLAAQMWANGYRLAGSNTLLVVRASKAKDVFFAKPLQTGDQNTYILRDGELLKKVPKVKLVLDVNGLATTNTGWAINVSGVGIFGNLTTDEGAQYDYYVNNLVDLVDSLNESSKFFTPAFSFYSDQAAQQKVEVNSDSSIADKNSVVAVVFEELYLGAYLLDTSDTRVSDGLYMMNFCTYESQEYSSDTIIDINGSGWSGFEAASWYAINANNSATTLKVRIRRFNHDAVITKELADSEVASLTENGPSPYTVLTSVLDTFTQKGTAEPSDSIKARDFFEVAVWDPSVNSEVSFFNVGNISGRGDMEVSEINSLIKMIQVALPDDLHDLGLNYFGYDDDDAYVSYEWQQKELPTGASAQEVETLPTPSAEWVDKYVTLDEGETYYQCVAIYDPNGVGQLFANLTIDPTQYSILDVSDTDLKKALDEIAENEVYTVEGLSDLGNTELSFQNYMANLAINGNYFYPISTANSTNYMTIGNQATKIPQDSYKLYMSAPWDIDTGTLGWKYYASPSVLYWEAVSRNRRNNEEFGSVFGQRYGVIQMSRPVAEFNKKQRQLLLSKKVNTVMWNVPTQSWNMNDCYTKTSQNSIMSEDGNSRLAIRIAKAMPTLLRQFIGRKINEKLCQEIYTVIDYWFKTTIMPMQVTVDAYQIFVPYIVENARANKQQVTINIRGQRSLKYITVYDDLYDVGEDISTDYHNLTA